MMILWSKLNIGPCEHGFEKNKKKTQFGSLHISGLLLHIYQIRGRLDVLYFLWLYNSR